MAFGSRSPCDDRLRHEDEGAGLSALRVFAVIVSSRTSAPPGAPARVETTIRVFWILTPPVCLPIVAFRRFRRPDDEAGRGTSARRTASPRRAGITVARSSRKHQGMTSIACPLNNKTVVAGSFTDLSVSIAIQARTPWATDLGDALVGLTDCADTRRRTFWVRTSVVARECPRQPNRRLVAKRSSACTLANR